MPTQVAQKTKYLKFEAGTRDHNIDQVEEFVYFAIAVTELKNQKKQIEGS